MATKQVNNEFQKEVMETVNKFSKLEMTPAETIGMLQVVILDIYINMPKIRLNKEEIQEF